jgi:hypothetical protein
MEREFDVSYASFARMETVKGKLVAADRDIGITIVDAATGTHLYCLNGPASPLSKHNPNWFARPSDFEAHYKRYDEVMSAVEAGALHLEALPVKGDGAPSNRSCAFAQ